DELVRQGARNAADAEPEDDLLERRDVSRLEAILDELGDLLAAHLALGDVLPHLAWRLRRVAGAVGAVELGERVVGDVDEDDVHARFVARAGGVDGTADGLVCAEWRMEHRLAAR